jgi:hypothetical protein
MGGGRFMLFFHVNWCNPSLEAVIIIKRRRISTEGIVLKRSQ